MFTPQTTNGFAISAPHFKEDERVVFFNLKPYIGLGEIVFMVLYADYFSEGSLESDLSSWIEDYLALKFTKQVFRITDTTDGYEKRMPVNCPTFHKQQKNIDGYGTTVDNLREWFEFLATAIRKHYRQTQTHDVLIRLKEGFTLSGIPTYYGDRLYLPIVRKVDLGLGENYGAATKVYTF